MLFNAGSLKYSAAEILAGEQTALLGAGFVLYCVMALRDLIWRPGNRERSLNAAKDGSFPRQSLLRKTAIYADHSSQQKASRGACLKVDLSYITFYWVSF